MTFVYIKILTAEYIFLFSLTPRMLVLIILGPKQPTTQPIPKFPVADIGIDFTQGSADAIVVLVVVIIPPFCNIFLTCFVSDVI